MPTSISIFGMRLINGDCSRHGLSPATLNRLHFSPTNGVKVDDKHNLLYIILTRICLSNRTFRINDALHIENSLNLICV